MSNLPPPTQPTPPFLHRIWPTVLPVLAALGIPTGAVTYYLTRHPLLSLAVFLLYELGVFVIGFLGKVWGKFEEPLAEHIAAWLKQWVITMLSRYHRQYYSYLRYQHRDFDMKGLSTIGTYALELDQVFVELRIDPSTPQNAVGSPVQVPQTLLAGTHSLWDYLTSVPLRQQHLVIIGPPGSGKTTLLKHVVLVLTAKRRLVHQHANANILGKMPILLFLRDLVQAINEQEHFTLVNAIQDHLTKWEQLLPPEGWFQRQLHRGRCLIMLDGLDEVADPQARKKVVDWVERQMTIWRRNRFLVTSRPFGYRSNPLPNVAVLEVRPFNTEQVERFVQQWYLANEIMGKQKDDPGVRMRARDEAKALLQRLRTTPAIFDLTVNPLLLTMIATVHRYGGELPGNRCALYAEMCEVFLGKRQQARGQVLEFTPAKTQAVLEPLAFAMMVQGRRDISRDEALSIIREPLTWVSTTVSPEAFLQTAENVSGLVLERENGVYSFAHLTFQEFLAACHLKEKQQGSLLAAHVEETWWRETIRLYCSMEDATPLLVACLQGQHPHATAIELAIDCDKEARKVRPEVRARLETLLQQGLEDTDPARQHVIASALLARRVRHMVHLKEETYVDTSFITCAEYQVFLDEARVRGESVRPDHWTSSRFTPGWGIQPILGVCRRDAEAFCLWLTEHDVTSWSYRLPKKGELEQEDTILRGLLTGVGYWLNDEEELSWVGTPLTLPEALFQEVADQFPHSHFTLDRVFLRIRGRTRTLDYPLARALDYPLAHDRTHDRLSTRTFARALADARDRACALDLALAHDLAHDLAFARARTLDLAFALAHARDLASDRDLAFAFARDHARDHDLAFALALAHDLAFALALDLARDRDPAHRRLLILELAMAICRASIIYLPTDWNQHSSKGGILRLFSPSRSSKLAEKQPQNLVNTLLDMYLDLLILKKRIQRALPACEGILLVKERK